MATLWGPVSRRDRVCGVTADQSGGRGGEAPRTLAFVLLAVQASYALLASVVQTLFLGTPFGLLAVLGLFMLAAATLKRWRLASTITVLVQGVMLLGTAPRLVQAAQAQAWPEGAWLAANIGLPLAVIISLRGPTKVTPAALIALSGLIHLALVGEHPQPLKTLFAIDGALLIAVAIGRNHTKMAIWLLLANLAAYLLIVVPGAETVDSLGLQTKLLELIALGLLLTPRNMVRGTLALVACTLLTGGLTWVSVARAGGTGAHTHTLGQTEPPSAIERSAAVALAAQTRDGIAQYADVAVARAAGYQASTPPTTPTVHYANKAFDNEVLVPSRPQGLVYATTSDGPLLVGALFQMPRVGQAGPTPGGALTHWHTHDNVCIALPSIALVGLASPLGICPPGSVGVTTPAMMHVWIVDNPGGPFADDLDKSVVARLSGRR